MRKLNTMQIQLMEESFMYNAVGIDASKFKSTVTVIQPAGIVIRKPFDVLHTSNELNTLVTYLKSLEGETRSVIECTGRYHEPVVKSLEDAGIFISAVNPKLIKGQKQNSLRKVKSDPADARKIAGYALEILANWLCICLTFSPLEPSAKSSLGHDAGIPAISSASFTYISFP